MQTVFSIGQILAGLYKAAMLLEGTKPSFFINPYAPVYQQPGAHDRSEQ